MQTTAIKQQANISSSKSAVEKHNIFFQPKLTVNQPNDSYEQEADAMADKVMRMSDNTKEQHFFRPSISPIQRKCQHCEEEEKMMQRKEASKEADAMADKVMRMSDNTKEQHFFRPSISPIQRKCQHCEEEEKMMQRKESSSETAIAPSQTENYISSLNGKGRSLTPDERNFFEPRFGYDFSTVQLHTDTAANESAKSINALAYTHANNIVFRQGEYQPATDNGKRLMAHELTHVVQQSGSLQRTIQRKPGDVDPTKSSACTMHFKQGTIEFTDAKEFAHCMQVIKDYLKTGDDAKVVLHGFASEEGTADFNMDLSRRRSEKVLSLLKAGKTDTSHVTIDAHGSDSTYPTRDANRRVEVVNMREITMPDEHVEGTPPKCPVTCKLPLTLFSDTIHCGGTDADFQNSDLPAGPAGITNKVLVYPYGSTSDADLLKNMKTGADGLTTFAGAEGTKAADHFFTGSAAPVDHDLSTPIGLAASKSPAFAATSSSVETAFNALVTKMAGTPAANNCSTLALTSASVPRVNFPATKWQLLFAHGSDEVMLKAVIGGTHGIEIKLTSFTVDCDAHTYEATINYRICDNFGVDETDMYSDSLISFWILQHMRTGHAAFVNNILLDQKIKNSF